MNARPKVSVVTVCRNAAATIEATLRSASAQTYGNLEYVVVDGASTDGTLEILRRHAGAITTLVSEPDAGIFNAMNKSLGLVKGDIVVFMNAGDVFASSTVVERVAAAFTADPAAMVVYGDCWEIDGPDRFHRPQPSVPTKWQLWLRAVCHQTIFARRAVYESTGGFDERLPICADWDWTVRAVLVARERAVHVPVDVALFALGGVCSNREMLERDQATVRRRYYTPAERVVFSVAEFFLKVWRRLRMRNFSPPWRLRRLRTNARNGGAR